MTSWYLDNLYPLQEKVCMEVMQSKGLLNLYLTGGTCLSRCYLNHRYSDDLDFFYHEQDKKEQIKQILTNLKHQFTVDTLQLNTQDWSFLSIKINNQLKVDFVKDVGTHFGELSEHQLYAPIDNLDNILANKISAIMGRDEPKDLVDIVAIASYHKINWPKIFTAINSKASGIMPPLVVKRMEEFPLTWLSRINWVNSAPVAIDFSIKLDKIAEEMLNYEQKN